MTETSRARENWRRRCGGLLTLVVAFPLLTGAGLLPDEAQAAETDEHRTATVSVTEVGPAVPEEGDELTLRGTITNEGDSPIINSSVAAREATPLTSRSAIDEAVSRTGFDNTLDGGIISSHSQEIDTIAPGMSRTFSLEVPLSEFALGDPGVYQIGVTLTGQTEAERWDMILGAGRTLLPWQPAGAGEGDAQTQLTVLWPLISTTRLTAQTGSDEEQTPAFRDDSLLEDISPGGQLYQMVALGAELPVTWVIDPDLVASVDAMTEDYQVYTKDGDLVPGDGQVQARAWLLALREAVQDSEVIALPFGDPDLASLAHQGLDDQGQDVLGALDQLRTATEVVRSTETVLEVEPSTDFAWPVEGAVDPSIVSVATAAGANNIIARSDSWRSADGLTYTPSAARPIGDDTTAIVADARLSTLFEGDMTSGGAASLAEQQLLAQTLSITQQAPATERSIVVAPQRMFTTAQAEAMAAALTTLRDEGDWVEFAELSEAAEAEPDPGANRDVPSAAQYPEELREQELPTSAFQAIRETQRTLDDFAQILTREDRVTVPYGNAIRRGMSTSWRGNEEEAETYRTDLQDDLQDLTEQVYLIQKSPITLSGRSATIPVTVQNNLVQDVQGLTLTLTSSRTLGLEVSEPQEITVNGGHSQSFKFTADANANGLFSLSAQLYTEDDKQYGEAMRFQARVDSITSTVMMVIAGGLLLVVLAGIRMYTQRKRAARTLAADGAEADERDEGDDAADTAANSASTSSKSEKLDGND
ncbi:DUF6049 family protein [Streptomyces sp. B6B3]|uniref:DUF6049 family protein n=1 Tax=Streptomyces sp. B6B3 TaxID=3153570 RepID=UPI00325D785B